jgi:hypothetical protein
VSGHWSQPLAVFSVNLAPPHDIDLKSQYTPHWVQALPLETFNWMSQSLLVNQGSAQPESTENKGEQK